MDLTRKIRHKAALKYCSENLIDFGCGDRDFINQYKLATGKYVYGVEKGIVILAKSYFDTATFLSSFDYMPERCCRIKESYDSLKKNGICIVICCTVFAGMIKKILKFDSNRIVTATDVVKSFEDVGYRLVTIQSVIPFITNMFIFQK